MSGLALAGTRLAVIGGGRMGEAIIGGLIAAGALGADAISVGEPDTGRRGYLEKGLGVACHADGRDAMRDADVVLLAVKPQVMEDVIAPLSKEISARLVVSIAAGISCAKLESMLPHGTPVIRVMPNTPALVGEGVALVSGGTHAAPSQVALTLELFSTIGRAFEVDEGSQDAGTALSGSGPAYFALVVDALAQAGVQHGLSRSEAEAFVVQTMLGTAVMLQKTGTQPAALIEGVASPGGTTVAALERLEAHGVREAFEEAVSAAVRRSRELGS